jgi:hypothetical protein
MLISFCDFQKVVLYPQISHPIEAEVRRIWICPAQSLRTPTHPQPVEFVHIIELLLGIPILLSCTVLLS